MHPQRPAQERVVSTPEWPVPYYSRVFRAETRQSEAHVLSRDLDEVRVPMGDLQAYFVREQLSETAEGQQVLQYAQDELPLREGYVMTMGDSSRMAQSYARDLANYIDVA